MMIHVRADLLKLLDAYRAYDEGALDSGLHDPIGAVAVRAELSRLRANDLLDWTVFVSEFMDLYEMPPYTVEDREEARQWLLETFMERRL